MLTQFIVADIQVHEVTEIDKYRTWDTLNSVMR